MFDHFISRRVLMAIGCASLAAIVLSPAVAVAGPGSVLVSTNGANSGNGASDEPCISRNGRFVVFDSSASDLVPGDTNGTRDVFLRDLATQATERVSLTSSGAQTNSASQSPAVNADGRYVTFQSSSTNYVPGDTNGTWDVFVRDRATGTTERVSVGPGGEQANGASEDPAISADGRYVAFESDASNLVPGDTNRRRDVFVYDRATGGTTRVSVHSNGSEALNGSSRDPELSNSGRFVVFDSGAANLVARDTNGSRDIFIHDLMRHRTQRVSVSSRGAQATGNSGNATVSADGRFVAFESTARNLVAGDTSRGTDVFVRDRGAGRTVRVSVSSAGRQAAGTSGDPSISDNGRFIAFESLASNLVPRDRNGRVDVFLHDRIGRKTTIVSLTASGGRTRNGNSDDPALSGNARAIAFESTAPNIVTNDRNGAEDIFRISR